jgi:hypothetical protein
VSAVVDGPGPRGCVRRRGRGRGRRRDVADRRLRLRRPLSEGPMLSHVDGSRGTERRQPHDRGRHGVRRQRIGTQGLRDGLRGRPDVLAVVANIGRVEQDRERSRRRGRQGLGDGGSSPRVRRGTSVPGRSLLARLHRPEGCPRIAVHVGASRRRRRGGLHGVGSSDRVRCVLRGPVPADLAGTCSGWAARAVPGPDRGRTDRLLPAVPPGCGARRVPPLRGRPGTPTGSCAGPRGRGRSACPASSAGTRRRSTRPCRSSHRSGVRPSARGGTATSRTARRA